MAKTYPKDLTVLLFWAANLLTGDDEGRLQQLKDFAPRSWQTLRQRGFQALLVGDVCGDLLLEREPEGYDWRRTATPEQVMGIFPETYAVERSSVSCLCRRRSQTRPAVFRRISLRSLMRSRLRLFRSDIGYSDGRHPDEVRFKWRPAGRCLRAAISRSTACCSIP